MSSIDPKILKRMQGEDGFANPVLPTRIMPVVLKGSTAQVKWANTIRDNTLCLDWPAAVRAKLLSVFDSTWWIANKTIVNTMKFKEPSPAQIAELPVDAEPEEEPERYPKPTMIPPRSEAAQKLHDMEDRATDAEKWAESVSQHPLLSKAAILAVLSKLYKEPMKSRLKKASLAAYEKADGAIEKDKDAIRRMLE